MQKETEKIVLSHDHYHREVAFDIIDFDSGQEGPHVFLQASVHGAELQGNLVIQKLVEHIEKHEWNGRMTIVPFANPWGTHAHQGGGTYGRFDAVTGKNWNRAYHNLGKTRALDEFIESMNGNFEQDHLARYFKGFLRTQLGRIEKKSQTYGMSRAERLTLELQMRSCRADIFLDLHTAPVAGLYLYVPEYLKEKSKDLAFPINLIIPHEFADAGDEAHFSPWCALQDQLKTKHQVDFEIPVEAYTLELGNEDFVSHGLAEKQVEHIFQLLHRRGVLVQNPNKTELFPKKCQHLEHYKTYYSKRACVCDYHVSPEQEVSKGDLLATLTYWNHEKNAFENESLLAQADSIVVNHFSTSNLEAGTEIFQLLENPISY